MSQPYEDVQVAHGPFQLLLDAQIGQIADKSRILLTSYGICAVVTRCKAIDNFSLFGRGRRELGVRGQCGLGEICIPFPRLLGHSAGTNWLYGLERSQYLVNELA
jgi:hypothetical protein